MANIKLNYTAFTSSSMAQKVTDAMNHCLETGEAVRVANRRGKEFLLVAIVKDSLGFTFRFFSMYDHEEIGDLLFKAHHGWSEPHMAALWSMMGATYALTEHPFITVAKMANGIRIDGGAPVSVKDNVVTSVYGEQVFSELLEQERVKDQIHKQTGATHKATDSLGRVVYLSYKRSWFGLGKTKTIKHVLEVNSDGLWDEYKMKVNGESFTIQGVL